MRSAGRLAYIPLIDLHGDDHICFIMDCDTWANEEQRRDILSRGGTPQLVALGSLTEVGKVAISAVRRWLSNNHRAIARLDVLYLSTCQGKPPPACDSLSAGLGMMALLLQQSCRTHGRRIFATGEIVVHEQDDGQTMVRAVAHISKKLQLMIDGIEKGEIDRDTICLIPADNAAEAQREMDRLRQLGVSVHTVQTLDDVADALKLTRQSAPVWQRHRLWRIGLISLLLLAVGTWSFQQCLHSEIDMRFVGVEGEHDAPFRICGDGQHLSLKRGLNGELNAPLHAMIGYRYMAGEGNSVDQWLHRLGLLDHYYALHIGISSQSHVIKVNDAGAEGTEFQPVPGKVMIWGRQLGGVADTVRLMVLVSRLPLDSEAFRRRIESLQLDGADLNTIDNVMQSSAPGVLITPIHSVPKEEPCPEFIIMPLP